MSDNGINDDLLDELDRLLSTDDPEPAAPAVPAIIETAAPPVSPPPRKEPPPRTASSPAVPSRPAGRAAVAVRAAVPATSRVLVVDDSKDYRDVVHYLLKEKGYEVDTAEDGNEGLQKALRDHPDLILLDFNMPGLNGYELIQELRGHEEMRKTPMIMFTGARNRRQLRDMNLDVQDFLDKPVSNSQLLASVAKLLKPSAPRNKPAPPAAAAKTAAPAEAVIELGAAIEGSFKPPAAEPAAEPTAPGLELTAEAETAAPDGPEEPGGEFDVEMPEGMPNLQQLEGENLNSTEELLIDIEKDDDKVDDEAGLEAVANDSPLINRVNKILVRAVEMGASDIHIEPQEHEIAVRLRLNGSLKHLCSFPSSLSARLAARVKIMSDLVITERRLPQDGQFRATINRKKVEFRVSTLPGMNGEKIVMRVLGGSKLQGDLDHIGLREADVENASKALRGSNGLILVTGPTGSGKTTTLYTMISTINNPDVNVMTAEDPVEYRLSGITQVPVRPDIGLTFEKVLRAFLRQDPDIMLVGEIRDIETAEIAVKASITGHLVLSTLHTNSAPATVARLTHMGMAPFLVAASVKLIVAQRLIKVLCDTCKLQVPLSEDERKLLSEDEAAELAELYRGVGCRECNQTGYTSRMPIFEVMPITTSEMRSLILSGASVDALTERAKTEGMQTLREAALGAVADGRTSLGEALKIILSG
ncbi:MAG: ATPase, T2SS/T4P/T4SS family [Elusimicrobiota bacterium]